jgi:hypothetical protein
MRFEGNCMAIPVLLAIAAYFQDQLRPLSFVVLGVVYYRDHSGDSWS